MDVIETAEILIKECFAAWETFAAFLSLNLLVKSYKNLGT